jgi:transporter family protein
MWIAMAFGSAIFAGLTSVTAKLGIRDTDSDVATALRTCVVLVFAWLMAWISGGTATIGDVSPTSWLFLVLSGLATGASWLCYFKALSLGSVSRVVVVDKLSVVLTMVLALILFSEPISAWGVVGIVCITLGTLLMTVDKSEEGPSASDKDWLPYAIGSAVFASLTALLGKAGIEGVDSNLGTAIRTCVVLVMAWVVVGARGKLDRVKETPRSELGWIAASGLATGASWLCYWSAMKDGPASVVVPIDKLSVVVAVAFSVLWLHEHVERRQLAGLALTVVGTLAMLL